MSIRDLACLNRTMEPPGFLIERDQPVCVNQFTDYADTISGIRGCKSGFIPIRMYYVEGSSPVTAPAIITTGSRLSPAH